VEDFDALQKRKAEARAAALDKDPIWRGLLDKKIVIGMTLEQVRSIATPAIEHKSSEEAEREVYTWDMPAQTNLTDEQDNSSGWYMLSVVFHKGKVTSWSRHNHAAPKPVRVDVEHQAIPGQ